MECDVMSGLQLEEIFSSLEQDKSTALHGEAVQRKIS